MKPRILVEEGGEPGAIDALDRGLLYGDGLFETLSWRAGRPRFWALHWARLRRGGDALGIVLPEEAHCLRAIRQVSEGLGRATAKLIVTRGSSEARGYAPPPGARPRLIACAWPEAGAAGAATTTGAGLRMDVAGVRLAAQPRLAGFKHLNRLEQVLARSECAQRGLDELVMLGPDGEVVCATMANVFAVLDDQLCTPPIERCGVAGVARAVILREAPGLGLPVVERTLSLDDLDRARELFCSNSRIGAVPVTEWRGRRLAAGPVASRLARRLEELDE